LTRSTSKPLIPQILSVETATLAGSVVLSRGDERIAALAGDSRVSHSNTLLSDIDRVLSEAQVDLANVDLFAVATGPGSFTGLRIGIATVKGLAATLGCQTAGVPTLHAVALAGGPSSRSVALLPAGRGEVFAQLFSVTKEGLVTELDKATHISPSKLLEKYSSLESVLWCGEGAIANKPLLENIASQEGRLAPAVTNLAIYVAKLAFMKFREQQLVHPDALQAMYVRPSDAELKV
jgi:tRNA threonylcarbamoyladenosine biosynthesis protein TsaB